MPQFPRPSKEVGNVKFATLADVTSYTAQTTLEANAKNIRVLRSAVNDLARVYNLTPLGV